MVSSTAYFARIDNMVYFGAGYHACQSVFQGLLNVMIFRTFNFFCDILLCSTPSEKKLSKV